MQPNPFKQQKALNEYKNKTNKPQTNELAFCETCEQYTEIGNSERIDLIHLFVKNVL